MKTDFSTMLSALRRERGISQKKAAGDLDVSQALLSHYENGVREPKFEFIDKVCDYYGVSADYILGRQQSDAVVVPCESGYSSQVAGTALEIVEFMEALDNEAVERALVEYVSFSADRVKSVIRGQTSGQSAEAAALESLYMSFIYRAAKGESTKEIEETIKKLRELVI